jgi:CRISPR-associated protein Csh1
MLKSIVQLGKIRSKESNGNALVDLCEPITKAKHDTITVINVELEKDTYKWKRIGMSEISWEDQYKLLHKQFKKNIPNASPTARYSDKCLDNKFYGFFQKILKDYSDSSWIQDFNTVAQVVQSHRKDIEEYIANNKRNFDSKRTVITLTFTDANNKTYYVADIYFFVEIFRKEIERQESKYKGKGVCSICGKEGDVYGGVFPFKFFITDKVGFLNRLNAQSSIENFPVCDDCMHYLQLGKWYIDEHLYRTFVKELKYYLIPETFDEKNMETVVSIIEDTESKQELLSTRSLKNISDYELDLLNISKNLDDSFSFNFLFTVKSNSAEKILAYIHDIVPSRLSYIYSKMDDTNATFQFLNGRPFNFSTIREFYMLDESKEHDKKDKDKKQMKLDEEFVSVLEKIFYLTSIDPRYVHEIIRERAVKEFKKMLKKEQDGLFWAVRDGLEMLYFFEQLGILQNTLKLTEVKNNMDTERYDKVFEEHFPLFNTAEKRWVFLLGVAARIIMDEQKNKYGQETLHDWFKNFEMRKDDFIRLKEKMYFKARQYDSTQDIGPIFEGSYLYFALIQDEKNLEKMSVAELNNYFLAGIYLSWNFRKYLFGLGEKNKDKDTHIEESAGKLLENF